MNDESNRKKRSIIMGILLGLIAFSVFASFIWMTANGYMDGNGSR